jgi:DNA polymerase epsilon subunit 1
MLDENGVEKSGLDLYFLDKDNNNFKGTVFYDPYFYVDVIDERFLSETAQHIQKRFEGCRVEQLEKEDLDMPGHLSGKKHRFLKLSFNTVQELIDAKSELRFIIYIILFYILYLS